MHKVENIDNNGEIVRRMKVPNGYLYKWGEAVTFVPVRETKTSTVKQTKAIALLSHEFIQGPLIQVWAQWKKYKQEQHKFSYASEVTENSAINSIKEMSNNNPTEAIEIITHTMANGWKGFVKPNKNEQSKTNNRDKQLSTLFGTQ